MIARTKLVLLALFVLTLLIAGCDGSGQTPQTPSQNPALDQQANKTPLPDNGAKNAKTMSITIYHATKDAAYLVPEVHVVPVSRHPLQTAVELLIAGTKQPELVAVMPAGTQLRSIWVKDTIAYVDFNNNLVKNNSGGSAGELLLVGAIVNTLTEFPEVQKVQIMVEGKKVETLTGHLDTSEPLSRSVKLIKK